MPTLLTLSLWIPHFNFSPKGIFQGLQDIQPVFSYHGNITAKLAEPLCACFAAKSAGDLLFQLEHSDVPFAEIVVEVNPEIVHIVEDTP